MRCRNCDEPSTEEYCNYCAEHNPTRCKWCGVICEEGLCNFCRENPPKVLDKCCKCGVGRKFSRQTFKRNGNWCGDCINEIDRKLKEYDGSIPLEDFLSQQ